MDYITTFIEGIATFVSPCLLPMLPIYLLYLSGQDNDKKAVLKNALGFVLGFTIVFTILGILSSILGSYVQQYSDVISIVFGLIVILFGINFTGFIKLPFINSTKKLNVNIKKTNFFTSILFGIIFSLGWSPCIGAFLGSALLLVSTHADVLKGTLMLITYSIGLGIPFMLSALLIEQLKGTFEFIKKHYRIINMVSGILLILIGLSMIIFR